MVSSIKYRPDFSLAKISRGCWQLAADHSNRPINDLEIYNGLAEWAQAGITTFVASDLYDGVEDLLGRFRRYYGKAHGQAAARQLQFYTTYAPGFDKPYGLQDWTNTDPVQAVDKALQRMGIDQIPLLQFYWHNYENPRYVEAAIALQDLKLAGKIGALAVTNMDVTRLHQLLAAGVDLVANTVQYSLLDRRPENGMDSFCLKQNIALICYGSLGGGFLTSRWLGKPDPTVETFHNASLNKYYGTITDFGGWDIFQELLKVLNEVAMEQNSQIATIASRYVYERPSCGSIIIGAMGSAHLKESLAVESLTLRQQDYDSIQIVLSKSLPPKGDCYHIERSGRFTYENS